MGSLVADPRRWRSRLSGLRPPAHIPDSRSLFSALALRFRPFSCNKSVASPITDRRMFRLENEAMAKEGTRMGNALAERLAKYAGECLRLAAELPETKEGRHVRDQLARSGTAPGAHHAEARSAQSQADFIHKIGLAAKEARESVHWLRTSVHAQFLKRDIRWLVDEGQQITAILTASLNTARNNNKSKPKSGSGAGSRE